MQIPFSSWTEATRSSLVALVFGSFLSACGGGGGGGSDPLPVPNAPTVTSQPASITVQAGETATFSVTAAGDAPLSYQWQRGGADVPGATSTTYTLGQVQLGDNSSVWTARVTNPAGTVTSAGATLSVVAIPAVGTVTVLAGDPTQIGDANGAGSAARFNQPQGLAVDSAGNLFVAERTGYTIRKIVPGGVVSTLAGLAGMFGTASAAAVARDAAETLYFTWGNSIQKRTADGEVTTLAGSVTEAGVADGLGQVARFGFSLTQSAFLALDSLNNLYVSDAGNHTIRKITPTGEVNTVVGQAGVAGHVVGSLPNALLNRPQGIAVVNEKILYVASGQAILKIEFP